ncbi:hypothetical protein F441_01587 [Phytophthora nicotianae CJ01A1]|nr:hypothetical protein L915_01541 [Phytophthora nicotianae]ETO84467.1 hypothetical protein F444_01627 [Phytophthora nicotianae P1976]ETP25535.1 hypothetical protein F441_01587 [Phytophthora nicotianae CJ01A1]ETL48932.1 hypothetical protein L916_01515 [Phytophthora nicotianae]ETM01976.1 hypothetical protein L917_01493 [Phytophthora nicotianae]
MCGYSMLSAEIVRPVFQRDIARSGEVANPLKRGVKRPDVRAQLPTLPVVIQSSGFAPEHTQAESFVASYYNTNTLPFKTGQPQPKQKRIRLKTERRRQQCRANQARYRQRKLNYSKTVEQLVQKLRADIPVLELQRNKLRDGGQQDIWDVVTGYFRIFRFGVQVVPSRTSTDFTPENNLVNEVTKNQLAFLHSSMTEDVNLGERTGLEALMNQWRLYTANFENLCLNLESIERTTDRFFSASAVLNVTMSEATLDNVFPHFRVRFLRSKLLGQRLRVPYSVCFEWDADAGRLSRVEATTNFIIPLMRVLGNLADVASVLEHALITRDGVVGI